MFFLFLKKYFLFFVTRIKRLLDNRYDRDEWIIQELHTIEANKIILDAGCGSQPYRSFCNHLHYFSQDIGQYKQDEKKTVESFNKKEDYVYGELDYIGNIWKIDEKDEHFDVILC